MVSGSMPSILLAASVVGVFWAVAARCADGLEAAKQLAVSHCSQCHTFGKGEPHGQGPSLFGLLGREAGTIAGFTFSKGYRTAMQGKVWDAALLDRWLTDTLSVAPGTAMIYWQDDSAKRAALVRFFESLR